MTIYIVISHRIKAITRIRTEHSQTSTKLNPCWLVYFHFFKVKKNDVGEESLFILRIFKISNSIFVLFVDICSTWKFFLFFFSFLFDYSRLFIRKANIAIHFFFNDNDFFLLCLQVFWVKNILKLNFFKCLSFLILLFKFEKSFFF